MIEIHRSAPENHRRLTEIAHAAKRYWRYPERYIRIWKDDLTLTPELIAKHPVYEARREETILGFYMLLAAEPAWSIEHMWVDPRQIGGGVGGRLFRHAVDEARRGGARRIRILSDPNATGFYEHMGAHYVGDHVGELEGRPRILPIYDFIIAGEAGSTVASLENGGEEDRV